jgi:hypothetical protein
MCYVEELEEALNITRRLLATRVEAKRLDEAVLRAERAEAALKSAEEALETLAYGNEFSNWKRP